MRSGTSSLFAIRPERTHADEVLLLDNDEDVLVLLEFDVAVRKPLGDNSAIKIAVQTLCHDFGIGNKAPPQLDVLRERHK